MVTANTPFDEDFTHILNTDPAVELDISGEFTQDIPLCMKTLSYKIVDGGSERDATPAEEAILGVDMPFDGTFTVDNDDLSMHGTELIVRVICTSDVSTNFDAQTITITWEHPCAGDTISLMPPTVPADLVANGVEQFITSATPTTTEIDFA